MKKSVRSLPKLTLNRETVCQLENELKQVAGGLTRSACNDLSGCFSCYC